MRGRLRIVILGPSITSSWGNGRVTTRPAGEIYLCEAQSHLPDSDGLDAAAVAVREKDASG